MLRCPFSISLETALSFSKWVKYLIFMRTALAKLYEKKKQEKTLSINKLIAEYERLEAMMLERKVASMDGPEVKGEINYMKECRPPRNVLLPRRPGI